VAAILKYHKIDLLLDAPLGLNALSFVIVTFLTRFLIRERRILTLVANV
jgi:rod shape-determining protein MreD